MNPLGDDRSAPASFAETMQADNVLMTTTARARGEVAARARMVAVLR
jgi:hypothetical protein